MIPNQRFMKVIIAGSRTLTSAPRIVSAIHQSGFKIKEVVSGGCRGVDLIGEDWANGRGIPIKIFFPDWESNGKSAGPIRNRQMAEYADAAVVVWDGNSRGTKNMIEEMNKLKKPVYCHIVSEV